MPLLALDHLRVTLPSPHGPVSPLQGITLTLERGDTLGLIGESGCGKSMTALAIMGLLPEGARVDGRIVFDGQELTALADRALCGLRGDRLGMVFQEPMTALNPLHTVGRQIAETLRLHRGLDAGAARAEAVRLLDRVQMPQPAQRLNAWPHQLSGGQRQRVVIAIALACKPALLIADEPTTALDATVQREVLSLITELVAEDGMALLLISHDLGVMRHQVQRLAVMYAGRIVEHAPTEALLTAPAHPYTQGLIAARPRPGLRRGTRLPTIAGQVPPLHALPAGCAYADRCPRVTDACKAAPPPEFTLAGDHGARCIHVSAVAV